MNKLFHVPYVYLEKENDTTYNLFIRVFFYDDEKITFNTFGLLEYEVVNGSVLTSIDIDGAEKKEGSKFSNKKISIDSTSIREFDEDTFCIIVEVKRNLSNTETKRNNIVFFRNADTEDLSNTFFPLNGTDPQIAYNCPYLYLTNPNVAFGQTLDLQEFRPFFFISLNGYNAVLNSGTYLTNINGAINCEPSIQLSPTSSVEQVLSSNLDVYRDPSRDGYYEVVLKDNNRRRRKGKLRHADSDTNPNSFIEVNPFI